ATLTAPLFAGGVGRPSRALSCSYQGTGMVDFTPFAALTGGGLIGLASAIYLLAHGRICGISGILGGLLCRETDERAVRLTFFGGLLAGGAILAVVAPSAFASAFTPTLSLAIATGLLVGFGTQLGSGC